jgi:hypothetical protein
VSRIQVGV